MITAGIGQAILSGLPLQNNIIDTAVINNNDTITVTAGSEHLTLTLTGTGVINGTFRFPGTQAATPVHGLIRSNKTKPWAISLAQQKAVPSSSSKNGHGTRPTYISGKFAGGRGISPSLFFFYISLQPTMEPTLRSFPHLLLAMRFHKSLAANSELPQIRTVLRKIALILRGWRRNMRIQSCAWTGQKYEKTLADCERCGNLGILVQG